MKALIFILAAVSNTQFICSKGDPTFAQCISNAISDPNTNQRGFNDPIAACAAVSKYPDYYNKCICDRILLALPCYNYCPDDPTKEKNTALSKVYCKTATTVNNIHTAVNSISPLDNWSKIFFVLFGVIFLSVVFDW